MIITKYCIKSTQNMNKIPILDCAKFIFLVCWYEDWLRVEIYILKLRINANTPQIFIYKRKYVTCVCYGKKVKHSFMRRRAYPRAASAYSQENTIILHFEVEFEKKNYT